MTSLMVIPDAFLHGSTTVCTTEKDLLSEVPTPPVETLKLYVYVPGGVPAALYAALS